MVDDDPRPGRSVLTGSQNLALVGSAAQSLAGRTTLTELLTRLGEAFSWEDLATCSEVVQLGDLAVRIASPAMLYRMKKDTIRPQDRVDAARIRDAFRLDEES